MPRVHGQLSLVTEQPESISEAHVRAPETRALGSGVVTGSPDRVRVEGGVFDAVLAPGPCVVTLVSLGVPVQHLRLVVPEGDVSLRAAFEAGLAADAGDRSVLERLAGEAAGALEAAEAANRAAGEAVEAAAGSASEAAVSAGEAAGSAAVATERSGAAESSATSAAGSADEAGAAAERADSSAAAAAASESAAEASATSAGRSATEAGAHADRAEGVVDSVRWDDDRLTVMGKTSPSLRGEKGDKGEQGDSGASTWDAVSGKPNTFPPTAHQHKMKDITDLPSISYDATGMTIPLRTGGGHIRVHTPTFSNDATPKSYVDIKVAEARALVETRAVVKQVTSPPSTQEPGVLYVIPE